MFAPPSGGVVVMTHDESVRAELSRGTATCLVRATGQPSLLGNVFVAIAIPDDGRITKEADLIAISK